MKSVTIVLNDPGYGTDRPYNALRLASALQEGDPPCRVRVFLMGDAVNVGLRGQSAPSDDLNLGRRIEGLISRGAEVAACGLCLELRGLAGASWIEGVRIGSMAELASWVATSDQVLTF
ncbi:MAG: DsrE family protein [Fimbriimonadales bacterium]|nr:DsrE family protein [Fimbriimonadales bacterium]